MKVQQLLTDPSKWTQKVFARDAQGDEVEPDYPEASCWCLLGAIVRCYPQQDDRQIARDRLYNALEVRYYDAVAWNDDPARTFAEVQALVTELDL